MISSHFYIYSTHPNYVKLDLVLCTSTMVNWFNKILETMYRRTSDNTLQKFGDRKTTVEISAEVHLQIHQNWIHASVIECIERLDLKKAYGIWLSSSWSRFCKERMCYTLHRKCTGTRCKDGWFRLFEYFLDIYDVAFSRGSKIKG